MPTGIYTRTPEMKNGKYMPKECREKIAKAHRTRGGLSISNPSQYQREQRHRLGISKQYRKDWLFGKGISKTKEYKRLHRRKYKILVRSGIRLSIKTIQLIYEDNIKKYGTLTCYLCLKQISFGQDSLEHKIPLSRGGTNEYNNLAIACLSCNHKKHTKTEEEYRKEKLTCLISEAREKEAGVKVI